MCRKCTAPSASAAPQCIDLGTLVRCVFWMEPLYLGLCQGLQRGRCTLRKRASKCMDSGMLVRWCPYGAVLPGGCIVVCRMAPVKGTCL